LKISDTAVAALNVRDPSTFPSVFMLLKVFATLPVSTFELEQLFLQMERTLTILQSTMSEEKLEALILMQAISSKRHDI
jgi:hypothetical protein